MLDQARVVSAGAVADVPIRADHEDRSGRAGDAQAPQCLRVTYLL
jgi:hypothetical protein